MVILLLNIFFRIIRIIFKNKSDLILENIVLSQQITVYLRSKKQPKLKYSDRAFWVSISKQWSKWKKYLAIVQP